MEKPLSLMPTVFILCGATGDVVARKVLPALFRLFLTGQLPERFQVVAFARRGLSTQEFQAYVADLLNKQPAFSEKREQIALFCQLFSYVQSAFDDPAGYQRLADHLKQIEAGWGIEASRLFYLGVPPELYGTLFPQLAQAGLTKEETDLTHWTRVLVEKPIGIDTASAQEITDLMHQSVNEEQIYRIEHYLAKENVRNLLVRRVTDENLRQRWNKEQIKKITIRLWESVGVESRGAFYDPVGALRDVGQNHLLQLMAVVLLDVSEAASTENLREQRAEMLLSLPKLTPEQTIRAQYEGYRSIPGVAADSQTETYFALQGVFVHPLWQGVSFCVQVGKRLGQARKEIELEMTANPTPLIFPLEDSTDKTKPDGYERVLSEALCGDQSFFISEAELEAMWQFIEPIQQAWQENQVPLRSYVPDTSAITNEV